MTKIAILYVIYVFVGIIAVSKAQAPGGFLDSSKDVVIRQDNTSIEMPIALYQPLTIFEPYNTIIYQLNNCCLPYSSSMVSINSAFGLDKLLICMLRSKPIQLGFKTNLILLSYDKKTSEIVDHGTFFGNQKMPTEYYFSSKDPYRVYAQRRGCFGKIIIFA